VLREPRSLEVEQRALGDQAAGLCVGSLPERDDDGDAGHPDILPRAALSLPRRGCITGSEDHIVPRRNRLLVATAALAVSFPAGAAAETRIAYTSLANSSHVAVMKGDGSERAALTSGAVNDVSPAWSPAGTRLVFVRRRANGSDDLLLVNGDGTGLRRLTRTAASEANPVWSQHRGRLAYERGRSFSSFEIVVQKADGSRRRQLTRNSVPDVDPVWSPGGERIAFTRYVRGTNSEIFVTRADGTGVRRLTSNRVEDHHPVWSSQGKIAFVRRGANRSRLLLVNPDGSGLQTLWRRRGIGEAAWSPDGARLAVQVFDGEDGEIFVVRADGGARQQLTDNDVDDFGPVWSPGAGRIAFTRFAARSNDVWSMRSNGRDKRRLAGSGRHEAAFDWATVPSGA
jgi:Tol biopolymer transport system component